MFKILSVSGSSNEVVTDYYMDIIYNACLKAGLETSYFNNNLNPQKSDYIVVSTIIDALKYWLKGYKRIIIWIQGVQPEESYIKHNSKMRLNILGLVERFMLNKATFLFLVSTEMKDHFMKKYRLDVTNKSYIMPCFNTNFHPGCFEDKTRYEKRVFTYIGSLAVWQCFDKTLDIYKKIEDLLEDSQLRVYTLSVNDAVERISAKGIKRYSVEYVSNDELPSKLKDISYGFVVRDKNTVNTVATPTKISTYMACGVIPIFSDCLSSFFDISKAMKYVISLSGNNKDIDKIVSFCNSKINAEELKDEYKGVFGNYYNKDKYTKEIGDNLISLIKGRVQ